MTPRWIDTLLWIGFAAASVAVFAIGSTGTAMDMVPTWLAIGAVDVMLAGVLLWRHGVSLAMPLVIAVYVFANRWLLFYLFLAIAFSSYSAP